MTCTPRQVCRATTTSSPAVYMDAQTPHRGRPYRQGSDPGHSCALFADATLRTPHTSTSTQLFHQGTKQPPLWNFLLLVWNKSARRPRSGSPHTATPGGRLCSRHAALSSQLSWHSSCRGLHTPLSFGLSGPVGDIVTALANREKHMCFVDKRPGPTSSNGQVTMLAAAEQEHQHRLWRPCAPRPHTTWPPPKSKPHRETALIGQDAPI